MDKTGRNGIRVGDILAVDWKEKYKRLTEKHIGILKSYNTSVEFDLEDLEINFFKSIKALKKFELVDSEQYLIEAQKKGSKIFAR